MVRCPDDDPCVTLAAESDDDEAVPVYVENGATVNGGGILTPADGAFDVDLERVTTLVAVTPLGLVGVGAVTPMTEVCTLLNVGRGCGGTTTLSCAHVPASTVFEDLHRVQTGSMPPGR
jgi:hypothetical protein